MFINSSKILESFSLNLSITLVWIWLLSKILDMPSKADFIDHIDNN